MNYELAKELKDAGYPLIKWWTMLPNDKFGSNKVIEIEGGRASILILEEGKGYLLPTLSELIEACGDTNKFVLVGPGHWIASLEDNKPDIKAGTGSTPEEAVAKLWLALNKHD